MIDYFRSFDVFKHFYFFIFLSSGNAFLKSCNLCYFLKSEEFFDVTFTKIGCEIDEQNSVRNIIKYTPCVPT